MKKLLLIDSNALVYRAYHALPPLKSEGKLVNALYGFFLIFTKAIEDVKPDYVVSAFDRKEKTFRHEEFEDYKAQRPDMPDELVDQLPLIKQGLEKYGVPVLEKKGFEADDIIATLTKRWADSLEIVILSGDRDLLQLVEKSVIVRSPGRGIKKMINFDKEKVLEKYGVPPSLFVDYKALRGDPSDNIPGVKGIGKKRARTLIQKHGSIEEIYEDLDKVKKTFGKKLKDQKKQAFQSKRLVTLRKDVDLNLKLEEAKFSYKKEELATFFKKFNFTSLVSKYEKTRDQMKFEI